MPSVMPSRSSATISAAVVRLSTGPPGSPRTGSPPPRPAAGGRGPRARASRRSYLIRSVSKRGRRGPDPSQGAVVAVSSYGRAMAWHAERDPERIAIVHEGERIPRGELERRSNRLARDYAARGVRAGDLVTLGLPNGIEFFAACLATWKLGATPQPISSRLPALERRAILELARPALALGVDPDDCPGRPALPKGHAPDASLADDPLPDVVPQHVRCMTSGGSTGRPKLILELSPAVCDPEVPENGMQP